MGSHALLSASSSHRWLHCTPSARLCETYEDKGSDYAAEGTDAHALCEYKLRCALGEDLSEISDIRNTLTHYSEEMEDCADSYAAFILEVVETAKLVCPDPQVLIEQRLDFSKYVRDGFGTGDCVVIADGTLYIVDYKHGQGILVEASENPQMMCYALGALELFDDIYNIDTVSMTIYQPRRDNVSTCVISKGDLYRWADDVLKPAADLAFAGEGNFLCGEWCGFCKVKSHCRARSEANLELAAYEFRQPALLETDEIAIILGKADKFKRWIGDVEDFALEQALRGVTFSGWRCVEGRSSRAISDEFQAAATLANAGYHGYMSEPKLLGVTALENLVGKSKFNELLSQFVVKPRGKPVLVPENDKRPNYILDATDDFQEGTE